MTEPRTLPVRADFPFWWSVTVRWGDMDAMGHVNNMMYLQYLESARVGYFEALGWGGRLVNGRKQGPVVVSQTFNYRRQVVYPDELEVGVHCQEIRNRSFILAYGVFRKGSDLLVGDGITVTVWLDYGTGKAVEIPSSLREALAVN
ncbi:MAG TPA: thioesterase family protein [Candidatus Methylomirabilis sp.]|nr:thioesterase family protein [Candidatus Methylomirabilis sp.]